MAPATVIEARELTKRYGRRRGIEGVSFSVRAGETFGFLGPNGAGKTPPAGYLALLACVAVAGVLLGLLASRPRDISV